MKLTRYKGLVSIRLDNSIYNAMKIIRTPLHVDGEMWGFVRTLIYRKLDLCLKQGWLKSAILGGSSYKDLGLSLGGGSSYKEINPVPEAARNRI